MKLAAQGKVGLVDGKSAEVVARQVALLAWRRRRKGGWIQRSAAGLAGSGEIEGHPRHDIGTRADKYLIGRR